MKQMKSLIGLALGAKIYGLGIFLLWLTGCSTEKEEQPSRLFFRYNQSSGITSLDPAFAKDQANIWAVHQLFNGLVQLDDSANIQPCIAKSWQISEDGLRYTFFLRSDVFFHDHPLFPNGKGTKVTATDVVYSFGRLIDKTTVSTGGWIFNQRIDSIQPFVAINDTVFELRLVKPFAPMLGMLSMQYCSIVPKAIIDYYGSEFRANPVGTGAFRFKIWRENEALVLERNPQYFEKDSSGTPYPYLDGIKISFINNRRSEFLLFAEGKLDFISGTDPAYKDDLLTPSGDLQPQWQGKIQLLHSPYFNTEYLGILQTDQQPFAPLRNKLFRQAINYAIDRQALVRYALNNRGKPAESGFIPAGLPVFDPKAVRGYTYNPQKARQLLQQSQQLPQLQSQPLVLLSSPAHKDICSLIEKQLQEVGIPISVSISPASIVRSNMAKGKTGFFKASWIGDYPDAETFLNPFYGQHPAPPNYTRFNNAQFNALYQQALATANPESRFALYQEMDRIIIEEAPVVPLFYDEVMRFTQANIQQLGVNVFNLLTLKQVKKTQP